MATLWRLGTWMIMHAEEAKPRKLKPEDHEPYFDPIGVAFWLPPKCKDCDG